MDSFTWTPIHDFMTPGQYLTPSPEIVHIVRVDLDVDDGVLERLKELLSPEEVARADRYRVPVPRRHFIVCRASLRKMLASCTGVNPDQIEFDYGPHGKPALRQLFARSQSIEFSVSHSANQALIALAVGRRVGVDIEQCDSSVRILKLAQRFFSPREAAELLGLPEQDQLAGFYRGWTSKECFLKATGSGLSFPLNKFSVSLDPRQPARLLEVVDQAEEPLRWKLTALNAVPQFAAAVIVEAATTESVTLQMYSHSPGADNPGSPAA
jgi:4'-phosphopantetheinyl transferase